MVHPHHAAARRIISLIDLTDLADDRGAGGIAKLLDDAARHGTAAVCVWPEFVERAAGALRLTPVRVATVADFPGGDASPAAVAESVERSLDHGADEIDLVLPYRAVLAGEVEHAARSVASVVNLVHDRQALVKVILETGELGEPDTIRRAAAIAVDAGADFIKTSTGKTATGASLTAVAAMVDVVADADRVVGLKPSGGISTVTEATAYLDLVEGRLGVEATGSDRLRFGASSLLADALAILGD